MGKTKIAPDSSIEHRDVMNALHKARALAWALGELGVPGAGWNNLVDGLAHSPDGTQDYMRSALEVALTDALDEIEAAARKLGAPVTPPPAPGVTPLAGRPRRRRNSGKAEITVEPRTSA